MAGAAYGINIDVIAQQNFRNVSGGDANDFDAVFSAFFSFGLGQDVATATKYPFVLGFSRTEHFMLDPTIANTRNFQLTYAPGTFFFNRQTW